MALARSPYTGSSRKLVLAFDVGTTFSGISYSILDPGQVPEIKGVTRFPAQEKVGGASKIPTIIYYDREGKARAVGAEATRESLQDIVEDEGWVQAEWFKLHMRPKTISGSNPLDDIPPLPPGKSVMDLFADFLQYLYECARTYIQESHANGESLWSSVQDTIEFVLTHPNGWEGAQQQQMRKAAVIAGLVPDTVEGYGRVHFVTEGEASLHFCIQSGLTTDGIESGGGILIVDAGGGTIDISAYGGTSKKGSFEEVAAPQCHLQGSVYVTTRCEGFLKDYLRGSKFTEDIGAMKDYFDKKAKLTFDSSPLFIKFGSARDKDPKYRIRGGQLTLSGQPSVACIVQAIKTQCVSSMKPISSVFLVGGFSASEYLFSKLKEALEPLHLNFCRPDSHLNKAVADGAVSFYLDHNVAVRVSKFVYGMRCSSLYDSDDFEHRLRSGTSYISLDGGRRIPNAFKTILRKDIQVSETREFRRPFHRTVLSRQDLNDISCDIQCYRGSLAEPRWWNSDDSFSILCTIEADTSEVSVGLKPIPRRGHPSYFKLSFDVILSLGLTELTAQIAWKDKGKEKRSPARVVYDIDPFPIPVPN